MCIRQCGTVLHYKLYLKTSNFYKITRKGFFFQREEVWGLAGIGREDERRQISKINFIKPRNLSFWTKATHIKWQ